MEDGVRLALDSDTAASDYADRGRVISRPPVHPSLDTHHSRRASMKITIETTVAAPIEDVWRAWTTPTEIEQWNAASDDWHTTAARVDLRAGGAFSSRMEAKDGSMGFDFAGTYTKVEKPKRIEYSFGDRTAQVEFAETPNGVTVRVTFDAETTHPVEQQRSGWQAILENFGRHVAAKR